MADTLQRQAYELKLTGKDNFAIADALNVPVAEVTSLLANQDAEMESTDPSTVESRRVEVGVMNLWTERVDTAYVQGHVTIKDAVASICKLSESRCKLLGLYAPTKAEIAATLNNGPPEDFEKEFARLSKELGLNTNP